MSTVPGTASGQRTAFELNSKETKRQMKQVKAEGVNDKGTGEEKGQGKRSETTPDDVNRSKN